MPSPYTEDAFAYRVDFASRVIAAGQRTTRAFDTCFEMHDGDAVAVAVFRRSWRNPKLRANLWRYLGRSTVLPLAWANRRRSRADLTAWAAELRETSKRQFAEMMHRAEVERQERQAAAIAAGYTVRQVGPYEWCYVRPHDGSMSARFAHEGSAYHFAFEDMIKRQAAA